MCCISIEGCVLADPGRTLCTSVHGLRAPGVSIGRIAQGPEPGWGEPCKDMTVATTGRTDQVHVHPKRRVGQEMLLS